MNDLCNATKCNPRLFADDTCLFLSDSSLLNLELNCNIELQNLSNWCVANKLQINPQKSAVIIVTPRLNAPIPLINLSYNNSLISCYNSYKYLGITIDSKLSFKTHIEKITSKISRSVGILNKLRYVFPASSLVDLYFALVHSHFLFGLTTWGSTFPSHLDKLQKFQNKAVRIITNSEIRTPITPKFHKLGILKICDLYTYEIAKIMHHHSTQTLPSSLSSLFTKISNIHRRYTRSVAHNDLYLPKFSNNRYQNSIRYKGVKIWNSIPCDLRNQPYPKFKLIYKNVLLNKYL